MDKWRFLVREIDTDVIDKNQNIEVETGDINSCRKSQEMQENSSREHLELEASGGGLYKTIAA